METTETILIRKSNQGAPIWCGRCGMATETLNVEQATLTMSVNAEAIVRWIETGRVHCCEPQKGNLRLCLRSLLEFLEQGTEAHDR